MFLKRYSTRAAPMVYQSVHNSRADRWIPVESRRFPVYWNETPWMNTKSVEKHTIVDSLDIKFRLKTSKKKMPKEKAAENAEFVPNLVDNMHFKLKADFEKALESFINSKSRQENKAFIREFTKFRGYEKCLPLVLEHIKDDPEYLYILLSSLANVQFQNDELATLIFDRIKNFRDVTFNDTLKACKISRERKSRLKYLKYMLKTNGGRSVEASLLLISELGKKSQNKLVHQLKSWNTLESPPVQVSLLKSWGPETHMEGLSILFHLLRQNTPISVEFLNHLISLSAKMNETLIAFSIAKIHLIGNSRPLFNSTIQSILLSIGRDESISNVRQSLILHSLLKCKAFGFKLASIFIDACKRIKDKRSLEELLNNVKYMSKKKNNALMMKFLEVYSTESFRDPLQALKVWKANENFIHNQAACKLLLKSAEGNGEYMRMIISHLVKQGVDLERILAQTGIDINLNMEDTLEELKKITQDSL